MLNRLATIRDQKLSLWQSAVEEVAETIRDSAQRRSMLEGVTLHILSEERKADLPAGPPSSQAEAEKDLPSAFAVLSNKLFDHANAESGGSGERAFSISDLRSKIVTKLRSVRLSELRSLSLSDLRSLSAADLFDLVRNALPDLTRNYGKDDLTGWAQCIVAYVEHLKRAGGKPRYEDWKKQTAPDPDFGVLDYRLPDNAKVIMIGDWGSHMTDNVAMLRQALKRFKPDAIIHLGDVYYSGTVFECKRNVLDVMDRLVDELGIKRPPFFTIPGNHEYYSGGAGFHDMIGKINAGIAGAQQQASYFCLRTQDDKWQLLGMDTGLGDRIPGLSVGPSLQESEEEWHAHKLKAFGGSTILLSHHPLFSAHKQLNKVGAPQYVNNKLLETFSPFFDRVAAWYWGHEHNLVMFEDKLFGLKRGRLLGCGAFQLGAELDPYAIEFDKVGYIKDMPKLGLSDEKFYNHAFALLEFSPQQIDVTYFQYPSWNRDFEGPHPHLTDPLHSETILPAR